MADLGPIQFTADDDAGGRDPVSDTVAGAQAAAAARLSELESDTFGQGSTIGDIVALPKLNADPGVGAQAPGEALPSGSYYDPPRDYDGTL